MSNAPVPANAQAMPGSQAYNDAWRKARQLARELSETLAIVGDCGFVRIEPAGSSHPILFGNMGQADPLLATINAFRGANRAFNALDPETPEEEDAAISATYGPWQDLLMAWEQPAQSVEGAAEALQLILDEGAATDRIGVALIKASLAYLRSTGAGEA